MAEVKKTGFAGAGFIDNQQVLITSGNLAKDRNIPYIQPISIPAPSGSGGAASRTRVQYADGTIALNGSISFDVNAPSMGLITLSRLLRRGYRFPIMMFDGESGYELKKCYLSSLAASGSVGGLVTCSISFVSADDWELKEDYGSAIFNRPQAPLGYWVSGNVNVREWTLNYTQNATPVYLNQKMSGGLIAEDDRFPRYIRIGTVEYNLDVTTYEEVLTHDEITIYTSGFLLSGTTSSEGYTFGGSGDLGTYTHTFNAAAEVTSSAGSGTIVIEST